MTALNEETARIIHEARLEEAQAGVTQENVRQIEKWGIQHHPDGTGGGDLGAELADLFRQRCQIAAEHGTVTWRDILLEEVYEALAESDPEELAAELTQVAAVCTSWVADIRSRWVAEIRSRHA